MASAGNYNEEESAEQREAIAVLARTGWTTTKSTKGRIPILAWEAQKDVDAVAAALEQLGILFDRSEKTEETFDTHLRIKSVARDAFMRALDKSAPEGRSDSTKRFLEYWKDRGYQEPGRDERGR